MRTWEYFWVTHRVGSDELNARGAEGWELVAVCPNNHYEPVFYFKRQLSSSKDAS